MKNLFFCRRIKLDILRERNFSMIVSLTAIILIAGFGEFSSFLWPKKCWMIFLLFSHFVCGLLFSVVGGKKYGWYMMMRYRFQFHVKGGGVVLLGQGMRCTGSKNSKRLSTASLVHSTFAHSFIHHIRDSRLHVYSFYHSYVCSGWDKSNTGKILGFFSKL